MKFQSSKKAMAFVILLVVILLFSMFLAGCSGPSFKLFGISRKIHGSGNVVQEDRPLERFIEVVLSEEGDLYVDVGDRGHLVIEAEDNLQEYLVAEIKNGVLDIKKIPENIQLEATKSIRYYLTVISLESLTLKNSGDAEVTRVDTDHFRVRVSGSGSVHIGTLNADQLDIELTSSGNLSIGDGAVETQNITLSSSGEYDGGNVISQNASVRLSSSGNASIHVLEELEADLSSSGNVNYSGNPSITVLDSSSSGSIIKRP